MGSATTKPLFSQNLSKQAHSVLAGAGVSSSAKPRAGQLLMSLPRPLWMLPVWFSSLASPPLLWLTAPAEKPSRAHVPGAACAAFYQLLCIPPLSPPAARDELPEKMNISGVWIWVVCSKLGLGRGLFLPGTGHCRCHVCCGPREQRLAALCLPEQPLSFFQNGIGLLFFAGDGIISRRGLSGETLPKPRSSG